MGKNVETSYENPKNQRVKIKFRGIGLLEEMYENLEDGAELMFEQYIGISSEKIRSWLPSKGHLQAFRKPNPFRKKIRIIAQKKL